jgi:hypothetical protein
VASVSGQPFDEYVRVNILDALGMTDTFTEVPVELRGERLAVGHTALKRDGSRDVVPPFQTRGIAPAAGFASNVLDLGKFAMWQFDLLSEGGNEVLRASTLREMHRPQWVDPNWKTTWGLGFEVSRVKDRTFVGHGGGCPGYYSHLRLEPKTRIGVIVLTNTIGSEVELYTAKAFDLIAPAIEKALEDPDDLPERDPALDRYTGVYDSLWGQSAIVRWDDGLAAVWLGARELKEALVKLKKTGEHVFRRVREDDEDQLGEEFVFDVADDGTVKRLVPQGAVAAGFAGKRREVHPGIRLRALPSFERAALSVLSDSSVDGLVQRMVRPAPRLPRLRDGDAVRQRSRLRRPRHESQIRFHFGTCSGPTLSRRPTTVGPCKKVRS